jgi:hypothetical protein
MLQILNSPVTVETGDSLPRMAEEPIAVTSELNFCLLIFTLSFGRFQDPALARD